MKKKTVIIDLEAIPSENSVLRVNDIINIITEKNNDNAKLKVYSDLRKLVPPFSN